MPNQGRNQTRNLVFAGRVAWAWCLLAGTVLAQHPASRTLTWASPAAQKAGYYAILGEVVQPGVFTATGATTLQEVVEAARGLLPTASPSVRIIRGDRSGHTVFYTPQGRDQLQDGDFVLIDPLRGINRSSPATTTGRAPGVWIGLSGVSPRPVVVPMDPEWATLPTIMQALGQSSELAQFVQVVLPQHQGATLDARGPLPSGTIIAVPAPRLIAGNLPEFPAAREITRESRRPASTPFMTPPASTEPAEADFVPPSPVAPAPPELPGAPSELQVPAPEQFAHIPDASHSRQIPTTNLPYSAPAQIDTSANPASLPVPGSRLATILNPPATADAPAAAASSLASPQDRSRPRLPLDSERPGQATSGGTHLVDHDVVDIVGDLERPEKTATSSSFSIWQMLGISGTVATLIGVALGTRKYLEQQAPADSTESEFQRHSAVEERLESFGHQHSREYQSPSRKVRRSRLAEHESEVASDEAPVSSSGSIGNDSPLRLSVAALLANELPLTEESPDFPVGVQLHQHLTSDVESWRVDAAHPRINPAHLKSENLVQPESLTEQATRSRPGKIDSVKVPESTRVPEVTLELDRPAAAVPRPHYRPVSGMTVAAAALAKQQAGGEAADTQGAPAKAPEFEAAVRKSAVPASVAGENPRAVENSSHQAPEPAPTAAPLASRPDTFQPATRLETVSGLRTNRHSAETRTTMAEKTPLREVGKTPLERALSQLQRGRHA